MARSAPVHRSTRPSWFVPADSNLAATEGLTAATRFCSGSKFNPASLPTPMARVDADTVTASIDWNGDELTNVSGTQNVNFDATYFNGVTGGAGIISTNPLFGVNDWNLIRLNQIGAGRATARFSFYLGSIRFEGSTFEGSTFEGSTFEGSTFEGSTFEGSTFEGSTFEGSTFEGSTFEGSTFEGSTFEGSTFEGSTFEGADIDLDTLHGMGRAKPYSLTACVIGTPGCTPAPPGNPLYHRVATGWHNPTEGHVFANHLHRTDLGGEVQGSPTAGVAHNDPEHLPNGVALNLCVQSEFDDVTPHDFSPNSDSATVTAINDAPAANGDSYNANQDTVLNVTAPGVLGNDTDGDSPASSVKAVPSDPASTYGPFHGSVSLNADGSFTYTPVAGYTGPDSFAYMANNGLWTDGTTPMSPDSAPATVSIAVLDAIAPLVSSITRANPSPTGAATVDFTVTFSESVSGVDTSEDFRPGDDRRGRRVNRHRHRIGAVHRDGEYRDGERHDRPQPGR